MKTIQLTPQQRAEISDRRRRTGDRRIFQRLSAVLWSAEGRSREEVAALVGARRARSVNGSASSAIAAWSNSARSATAVTSAASGRPRSNSSSKRSPAGPFTTLSRCAIGSGTRSASPIRPRVSGICSIGSAPATTRSPASSGRRMTPNRSSSCGSIGGIRAQPGRRRDATPWTLATPSGAWSCSIPAGCWSVNGTSVYLRGTTVRAPGTVVLKTLAKARFRTLPTEEVFPCGAT
jgi:hypothetical protein